MKASAQIFLSLVAGFLVVTRTTEAADEGRMSVGAVVGQSARPSGEGQQPDLYPGFGGTSLATMFFVDVALNPTITVGGEASVASAITGAQNIRVLEGAGSVVTDHYDTVLSGMVKFTFPISESVHSAVVSGFGMALRRTNQVGTLLTFYPSFSHVPFSQALDDKVQTVTGGYDTSIYLKPQVGIMMQFRVHYVFDSDHGPGGDLHRGVSSWIFRYGAGVRFRF